MILKRFWSPLKRNRAYQEIGRTIMKQEGLSSRTGLSARPVQPWLGPISRFRHAFVKLPHRADFSSFQPSKPVLATKGTFGSKCSSKRSSRHSGKRSSKRSSSSGSNKRNSSIAAMPAAATCSKQASKQASKHQATQQAEQQAKQQAKQQAQQQVQQQVHDKLAKAHKSDAVK